MSATVLPQYTLNVGQAGTDRLSVLNSIYNEHSQQFLLNAGIESAKKVLEVGCGNGIMACWMAQKIQPFGGILHAVDLSEQQLLQTKQRAEQEGVLDNMRFYQCSAENLSKLERSFDFVTTRFVLAHLQQPERIFLSMLSVLDQQGTLAIEEARTSSHRCSPRVADFEEYYNLWLSVRKAQGANPDYGIELRRLFIENGLHMLTDESTEHHVKLLPPGSLDRHIFWRNMQETREHLKQHGLADDKKINQLVPKLKGMVDDKTITMAFSGSVAVAGKKIGAR